jgi:hypothetical protein
MKFFFILIFFTNSIYSQKLDTIYKDKSYFVGEKVKDKKVKIWNEYSNFGNIIMKSAH